jgi:hypothetical protein
MPFGFGSSAEIKFVATPDADRRSVEIVFVSEGRYPCTQTFRCVGIPAKQKP